jgi:hypothetical protein
MNPIQTSGRQFQSLCNFPQFLYITAQSIIIIQLIPMSSETKKKTTVGTLWMWIAQVPNPGLGTCR